MKERLKKIQQSTYGPWIVTAACTVVVLAIVIILDQLAPGIVTVRPGAEAPRFLPSVDLLPFGTLLATAWGISINHRCTDTVIARYVLAIVFLMALWLILAMGKLVVVSDLAKSLCWYMQSLPLLFIPLLFFFCVLRTSSLDTRPGIVVLKRILICIALLLFVLAVTNNFHHTVFVFDTNDPNWETNFSYRLGYYPFVTFMMATMVVAVVMLGIASHRKMRWRIVWIAVLFVLGLAYWAIVIVRGGGLQPGNNAVAGCMLFVAAIEFCFDLGFFPSAHHYSSLFRNLPFDLKIIAPTGTVAYRTAVSRTLDNTSIARLMALLPPDGAERERTTRSEATPGLIFKLYRLTSGVALLTEDASELDQLQARLRERQHTLANQNEVLSRTQSMQALLYRQERERELEERVERDLAATAQQISFILDNMATGDDDETQAERVAQLNLVKVLVAYSKRKGMLALAAAESDMMSSDQLNVIAREAMADLQSVGIECGVLVAVREPIPIASFNTIYDSFYDCIISVLPQVDPVVMTSMSVNGQGELEMRATIECAIGIERENAVEQIPAIATSTESWTAVQMGIARHLEERLSKRDSPSSVTLEDGLVVATVRVAANAPADQEVRA
ncbi:MAG: hypothetical protein IJG88_03440 [Eggerthellaceae bacterium]|nr:hypothetical protein [Eggerthellaceae bacterium]